MKVVSKFRLPLIWRIWRDDRGQIAVLFGLMLIPIMLALGLVLDGALMFYEHRGNRNAADAAALAATREIWNAGAALPFNGNCFGFPFGRPDVDAACAIATSAPFSYATDEVEVTIPPDEGPLAGESNHVQVVVTTQLPTLLIGLMGPDHTTVSVRAVGGATPGDALYAIYALSETACEGLGFNGNIDLDVTGGIKVNASCEPSPTSALEASSGTDVSADVIDVVGDADIGGGTFSSLPHEGTAPIGDPLAGLTEVVSAWIDTDLDGFDDAAVLSATDCLDSRCTAEYPAFVNHAGYVPTADLGVVAGSLRIPNYNGATLNNPQQYDVCTDPGVPVTSHPPYMNYRTLFPGVYPGGIKIGNCDVYWEEGVYVLAGRQNNGANTLDIAPPSAGREVVAPDGVLIYVTESPFAANSKQPAGEIEFHNAGSSSITMTAGTGAQCPPRVGYQDVFLFVDRDGPGGAADDASGLEGAYDPGDCNNTSGAGCKNEVIIDGGGVTTSLSGTLYDRTGRVFTTGSYSLTNTQLIFNVVQMQNADADIDCSGSGSGGIIQPRLRE